MPGFKIGRTTEDIRRELTAILREVKDPRVKDCLLSLVRVEVTNDLSYCTVYVSTMEGMERTKSAVAGLNMLFKATDSIEYGAHISKLLRDLEPEEAGDEAPGEEKE